jgi:hypothetical protein
LKDSRPQRAGPAARDRGFALIAFLLLVVLVSAYVIADQLARTNSELAKFREDRTMIALRQAKTALIAYAASEQWQNTGGATPFQPGAFPCPDRDNNGVAEDHEFPQKPCNTPLKRIGRLPWRTIGADDLHDASGERLWYAVSGNFLKNTPLYANIINSDTQGQLTVTGSAPANLVVAIVFAPGGIVQGQSRDSTIVTTYNDPANYLENLTPPISPDYVTFFSAALPSDSFNDHLLIITQADLVAAVEPVVAANIERDIKPYLASYRNTWGRYPFPVLFGDPATSDYKGVAGQESGLMPLTADSNFVTWQNPLATFVSDSPPASITSQDCSSSNATQIDCTVAYNGTPTLAFSLTAAYVGMAFVRSHVISDLAFHVPGPPLSPTPTVSSVNNSPPPDSSGTGTVLLSLSMPAYAAPVRIQIPPPPLQPAPPIVSTSWDNTMMTLATPSSAAGAGWFIANQWYRQVYYAVSPGFAPGGGGACNLRPLPPAPPTSPSCLRVKNLPPSYATPDDKRAILVFAGRELNGLTPRPANLANYLENANLTAALGTTPFVYEHRAGVPTAINDRIVVVAP